MVRVVEKTNVTEKFERSLLKHYKLGELAHFCNLGIHLHAL